MSIDPKPFRDSIRKLIDDGLLPLHNGQTALSLCDFAEKHGRHLAAPGLTCIFMGLGEVTPVFAEPVDGETGNWYYVGSVLEATGATWQQWEQLRDEEIAEAAEEPAVPHGWTPSPPTGKTAAPTSSRCATGRSPYCSPWTGRGARN